MIYAIISPVLSCNVLSVVRMLLRAEGSLAEASRVRAPAPYLGNEYTLKQITSQLHENIDSLYTREAYDF